jgi:membrane-associated phospholipid phosphatase
MNSTEQFKILFRGFWRVAAACFRPRVLPWHVLAMVLTWMLVVSGFDWNFYVFARQANLRAYFFPALILGSSLPILAPLSIYMYGFAKRNIKIADTGGALGQASIMGMLLSFFYKAFTGRMQPRFLGPDSILDISHDFRFGLLKGGVFWGWPSSHTTVSFALAAAIIMLFPKNRALRIAAALYAFYVGVGTAVTGIHWFSEFIAGVIFGTIAGLAVSRGCRNIIFQDKPPA